jgi:hypothetical protein
MESFTVGQGVLSNKTNCIFVSRLGVIQTFEKQYVRTISRFF